MYDILYLASKNVVNLYLSFTFGYFLNLLENGISLDLEGPCPSFLLPPLKSLLRQFGKNLLLTQKSTVVLDHQVPAIVWNKVLIKFISSKYK